MPVRIDKRSGIPVVSRTDQEPRRKRQGRVPGPGDIAKVDAEVLRDPGLHATPEDFGSGIGAAVADFGKAASRVASDFAKMRREAEDDTAAAAGLSQARVRFTRVARSVNPQATTAEDFTGNLDRALGAETDAIMRDLRQVRGLRPSKQGEAAIRGQLGVLASRMVARGAMFEQRERLAQLGRDVDLSVAEAATAAFDSPADFLAIKAETAATLARFTNKLPPDILAAKGTAAREMIAANAAAGLIELDPALAIEGLKGEFFGDSLPAAERKRLRARAKAAVSDRRAQAERGQSRERAAAGADGARRLVVLEGAIERGEAGEQAITEAADILDEPTRARLREKLDARRADDTARNRRIEKVSAVLAGRAPATGDGVKDEALRPGAPEWRQAVDDHYANLADALETMDPDTRARFEDDYARATGVLPEPVLKQVRAGLLSADPAAQAAAATRLARLKEADPALVSTIPANDRRRAKAIAEFADLGLPPGRAVELAEEKRADEKRAEGAPAPQDITGGADDDGTGDEPDPGGAGDDTPDDIVIEDARDGGVRLTDPATGTAKQASAEQIGQLRTLAQDVDGIAILDEGGAASLSANLPDPDAAPDELRQEIRELLLSILPITGEALSARDAYIAMLAARDALKRGDLSEASIQGALVALGVVGTVPVFGRLLTGARVLAKLLVRQRRRAVETAVAAARAASPRWFARWTDNILSGKVKPQGKAARVGKMSLKVNAFLKAKAIDADTTAIHVIDKSIRRMLRTGKPTSKQLPADFIQRMPEMLRKPKAVLWDKRKRNLLYVFDVPSDAKKGKFVVNVEFTQEVQRGDKLVLRKGNFVASGGRVPAITLKDRAAFELVEGTL